jgi:hypothetical protein
VAVAPPAEAAVPQHQKPTFTVPCDKKSALIWNTGHLVAAKNPCRQWLLIEHTTWSQSSPNRVDISVAPGAHFNIANLDWAGDPEFPDPFHARLAPAAATCGQRYAKNSHGKPARLGGCPDW